MRESWMQTQALARQPSAAGEAELESSAGGAGDGLATRRADPEVNPRARRRRFSSAYKARIVREAEACTQVGQVAALLRREGLYSSTLSRWRRLMRQGAIAGLDNKRGCKMDPDTELRQQVRQLERNNQRLKRQLQQAETVIEVQKKLSEILGIPLEDESEHDDG